ncbi:hypothetical protein ABH931_004192 [Streptacidiphilus sp. MAP12-33]|uniref:hypothetical protein n=1 Tax=Streptacidiphilus sp. MAP12-33 TaxID=3156266 RepID=UPI003518D966
MDPEPEPGEALDARAAVEAAFGAASGAASRSQATSGPAGAAGPGPREPGSGPEPAVDPVADPAAERDAGPREPAPGPREPAPGPRRLDPPAAAALLRLAARVERDLLASGLNAKPYEVTPSSLAGVEVEVDAFDDAVGGVWLHWRTHPSVGSEGSGATSVRVVMAEALVRTLTALGYRVEHGDDSLRPYAVRLVAGPDTAV